MELIARRQFVPAYIALDTVFLLVLAGLLLWKKRRMAALVGGIMGVVYFIVDYGVFHLICHSRSIEGGSLFWTLLWMSMSYGFTNFAWIWLALDKDEYLIEWSLLILCWWFCCPMLAQLIGFGQMPIVIQRTTGAYHGWMAVILFVGYLLAVVRNLGESDRKCRIDLLRLLAIGIAAQFAWEAALLLGGIRSAGLDFAEKLCPLIVNSLLETNLGMPYVYLIFVALTRRFTPALARREDVPSFRERIAENNGKRVRRPNA